jgi:peptidoglycan/LPS O-acetylase OafA/YrhL
LVFFYAQSHGILNDTNSVIFWYFVPALVYAIFAAAAYLFAKFSKVGPTFILWVYLATVIFSGVASFLLPQANSDVFIGSVVLATAVSLGVIFGLMKQTRRRR